MEARLEPPAVQPLSTAMGQVLIIIINLIIGIISTKGTLAYVFFKISIYILKFPLHSNSYTLRIGVFEMELFFFTSHTFQHTLRNFIMYVLSSAYCSTGLLNLMTHTYHIRYIYMRYHMEDSCITMRYHMEDSCMTMRYHMEDSCMTMRYHMDNSCITMRYHMEDSCITMRYHMEDSCMTMRYHMEDSCMTMRYHMENSCITMRYHMEDSCMTMRYHMEDSCITMRYHMEDSCMTMRYHMEDSCMTMRYHMEDSCITMRYHMEDSCITMRYHTVTYTPSHRTILLRTSHALEDPVQRSQTSQGCSLKRGWLSPCSPCSGGSRNW